jgi:hypothetical protein
MPHTCPNHGRGCHGDTCTWWAGLIDAQDDN